MSKSSYSRAFVAASFLGLGGFASAAPADLAETYGIVEHLPASTEGLVSFYNLGDAVKRLGETEVAAILRLALEQNGTSLPELLASPDYLQSLPFWGEEVFIAFGEGSVAQGKLLMEVSNANNYATGLQIAMGLKAVIEGESLGNGDHYLKWLEENPERVVKWAKEAKMPPITLGSRIPDAERQMIVAQLGQFLPMAMMANATHEIVSMVNVEQAGTNFTGIKVDGKAALEAGGDDFREGLREIFSVEQTEAIIEGLRDNDLVALFGEVDGYLVFHFGSDIEQFDLAEALGDSLASSGNLDFLTDHAKADPLALVYGSKEAVSLNGEGSVFGDLFRGFKAGLASEGLFGNTQELDLMLDDAAEQEAELLKLEDYHRFGQLMHIDDGLRIESYGGRRKMLITERPLPFTTLGKGENVAFFSTADTDREDSQKITDYISTIIELGYMVASKVAAEDIDDPDFREFNQGFQLFDQKFKADVLTVLEAITDDLDTGLGTQGAWVIDLNGAMPPVPNVPKALIDGAKVPRFSMVANVEDRAAIAKSWGRINGAVENIVANIGEMQGEQINMLRPMSTKGANIDSHFYAMPFFDGSLSPSANVSDSLFVLGSSTDHAAEIAAADLSAGSDLTGLYAKLDFVELAEYGEQWLDLLLKEGASFMGEYQYEDMKENEAVIRESIKSLKALGPLTIHSRVENGEHRSSIHLQSK